MPPNHPSQSLWDFALAFYAQPQVTETCLRLQDQYHVNVCVLIGLRWLDEREQLLSAAQLDDLYMHVDAWTQQVVKPLRQLRRQLKQPVAHWVHDATQEQLRALIKQAELLAEKKLLTEIDAWVAQIPNMQNASTGANVAIYLSSLNVDKASIELMQK